MIQVEDPSQELRDRKRAMDTMHQDAMDGKELAEREEATQAYAKEDEQHFVDYVNDCKETAIKSRREIREKQQECWNMFNEKEPDFYKHKAPWQSHTVVPRPFASVNYGAAAVKKAFSPDFLSIKDPGNQKAAEFWKTVMNIQLDESHAKFPLKFMDAITMGLAIGESMEMIPIFRSGAGLHFDLIEPWKIHRDPDAPARDPQGGMFWIHDEWLDYWLLKEGEKKEKYFDVARVKDVNTQGPTDPFMSKEAIAARRDMIWQRSKFRTMVLTSEFYGTVLSPKGELLLPSARLTLAGGRVIEKPTGLPYQRLRWPGISFSPMPSLLSSGGRGLLEGVLSVWKAMCNLTCLHEDALQWVVNPPVEINVEALVDPDDVESWPDKKYLVRDTMNGQHAIRPVTRRDRTNTMLANLQYHDQNFQRGSMVTDGVQGLPGYRKDMTFRESSQNLDQALGVYGLMGANIELGAMGAIDAAQDVIATMASIQDLQAMLGEEAFTATGIEVDGDGRIRGLPKMSGQFSVSGIQALMKDAETINHLVNTIMPMAEAGSRFAPYIRASKVIKALESRIALKDEDVFIDEETGGKLDEMQLYAILNPQPPAEDVPPPPDGDELPPDGGQGLEEVNGG